MCSSSPAKKQTFQYIFLTAKRTNRLHSVKLKAAEYRHTVNRPQKRLNRIQNNLVNIRRRRRRRGGRRLRRGTYKMTSNILLSSFKIEFISSFCNTFIHTAHRYGNPPCPLPSLTPCARNLCCRHIAVIPFVSSLSFCMFRKMFRHFSLVWRLHFCCQWLSMNYLPAAQTECRRMARRAVRWGCGGGGGWLAFVK